VKAADIVAVATVLLSFPVWIYVVRQQWSRKPGALGRMAMSGCLFVVVILTGMFVAELLS
jgi:hypothetical protein